MDLNTVETTITPTHRDDLWPIAPTDAILAGGTWLFSEPQPHVRRLVDITQLGWQTVSVSDDGIELAATATVAEVSELSSRLPEQRPDWAAAPLLHQCCTALLASFKIWTTATVGGNICLAFPAGAMISLGAALDAEVTVWRCDGSDYQLPITEFVSGSGTTALAHGEILRSVRLPAAALRSQTAYRKVAPSPLGRSGVVVIGRRDTVADGRRFVLSVTAATTHPHVFAFDNMPSALELEAAHATIPDTAWTLDAHGDPDWRRAVTLILAEQIRRELS